MGKGTFAAGKANSGRGGDSNSGKGKKAVLKAKPAREKKDRAPKEKSTPVDASALDNDMDSYFASRTAAAKE